MGPAATAASPATPHTPSFDWDLPMQALVSVHCLHYNDLLLDPHSDRRVPHARRDRWLMRVECGASVRAGVGRNVDRRLFEGLTGQRALLTRASRSADSFRLSRSSAETENLPCTLCDTSRASITKRLPRSS